MDDVEFRHRADSGVDEKTELLAYTVIGAAIEVHRILGPGLPESAYRDALCHEFDLRAIPYQREVPVPIYYKGKLVGSGRMDILVGECLVVELKVVLALAEIHEAQAISYLKATHLKLALLINFNVILLKNGIKRVVNTC
jgi:GxxExxY protein